MSTYQSWNLGSYRRESPPPPEKVFVKRKGIEDWQRLFLFASYCTTWNEEERTKSWFPIIDEGWGYLKKMLYYMKVERFLIILKVRQILATWSLAVLDVFECMSKPMATCGFASKGVDEGGEFLQSRCAQIYHNLPESWKEYAPVRMVRGMYCTKRVMAWENNSRIKCYSSRGEGPRSDVLTRAAIDEANYIKECKSMMASFRPALGKDRPLVVLSTPRFVESDFEEVVEDAEAGIGGALLKFPVTCRPGRDESWQKDMERQLGEDKYSMEYGLQFAIRESHALFPRFDLQTHVADEDDIADLLKDTGYDVTISRAQDRDHTCPMYCALDTHVTKPNAAVWMAVLPDETWYIYDEMWERVDAQQMARMILIREQNYRVIDRVIDPSANAPHKTGGMTPVSAQLIEAGLTGLRTADRHKIGFDRLQAQMEIGRGGRPGLMVHPRCKATIRQLRTAGFASEEKAMKSGRFHFLDCCKYIANCRPAFRVWKYQQIEKGPNTAYGRLMKELDDNMLQAQRGYGGRHKCRTTLH